MQLCKHWLIRSSGRGLCGATAVTACAGMTLAWHHNVNVLLVHMKEKGQSVEALFPSSIMPMAVADEPLKIPNGWRSLLRLYEHRQLDAKLFVSCAVQVMNRLDIIPGFEGGDNRLRIDLMSKVMETAGKCYDIVLWDVDEQDAAAAEIHNANGGSGFAGTIIVLPQVRRLLEEVFRMRQMNASAYVLGMYDAAARLNSANVKRQYKLSEPLFTMPYSAAYRNAADEKRLLAWFMHLSMQHKRGKRSLFMAEQQRLARFIMDESGFHRQSGAKGREMPG
ncbi:ABC transporter permease [Paenibacillus apiarius]|uniref:ABC transporter permease n=1 Tax=Paenibacillus apiarius TaxID=46240 RepID=UPI00197E067D|nr:ABC transporter permease [Paenibacillus apiarius]MBN3527465.1 ABC transporter permease [Paenibacillus apiarius]